MLYFELPTKLILLFWIMTRLMEYSILLHHILQMLRKEVPLLSCKCHCITIDLTEILSKLSYQNLIKMAINLLRAEKCRQQNLPSLGYLLKTGLTEQISSGEIIQNEL